ncbi:MAG: TAXI family TRAP transporter solute-binding subunit [Candidatus Rokubacteria bacterium]|nr:TAXI family TRAP transporter solute-binding subunit [Candidatus Rokubacteria bacterium]
MSTRRLLALALAASAVLLTLTLLPRPAATQQAISLRFMTGPQGGSWIPLGGAIAEVVQKEVPHVSITVMPGAGIANVKAIEQGKADLGFGNANSTADAIAGRKPFDAKAENVRHVVTLYNQYFQITVPEDTDIRSVKDFKGKRLAVQPVGNTGEQMSREVMQVYGLKYADAAKVNHLSYTDAVELLKNRQADVFTAITTIPASAIMDLATGRKVRLIGIDEDKVRELQKMNAGYTRLVVPKGTYTGQDADVVTIGTVTHLVASAKLPEELVAQITQAIVKHKDALAAVVKDIGKVSPKEMGRDIGLPVHPGAQRFFAKQG